MLLSNQVNTRVWFWWWRQGQSRENGIFYYKSGLFFCFQFDPSGNAHAFLYVLVAGHKEALGNLVEVSTPNSQVSTDPSKASRIHTLGLSSPGLLPEPFTAGVNPGKSLFPLNPLPDFNSILLRKTKPQFADNILPPTNRSSPKWICWGKINLWNPKFTLKFIHLNHCHNILSAQKQKD